MIEDEACPSAQAFTSWAKAADVSPSIFSQILTFEPHSLEWAWALGIGIGKRADQRNIAGEFENFAVIDVVHHSADSACFSRIGGA
jgi:hypothetical protein